MNDNKKHIIQTVLLGVFLFALAVWGWVKAPDDYSDSERRALAQLPSLTLEELTSGDFMSDFEDYTVDQFPLRDTWRRIKAFWNYDIFRQLDNNDVFIAAGHACKLEYPLNTLAIDYAANKFSQINDTLVSGSDAKVYLSVIPDKNYFLAAENGYLSLDYEAMVEQLRAGTEGFMTYIDIFDLLSAEDFYTTDTHWRQESILDVADRLTTAMGVSASDVYTTHTLDTPFYGVYHGQAALPLDADTLCWLTSDTLDSCTVFDHQNNREMGMYDMEKAYGKDAYEMFLSGSLSLVTIENPNASTDRELVIFRDSFGSSIAPLMVPGYAKVTLVDIRYLPSSMLPRYLTIENQDVLFLYSTLVLNNSSTLK